ncbi:MAG: hypothetical protein IJM87_08330 [Ruminococcus sp.]|nr:hypothetical protein [Ruminococcus sp.]
MSKQEHKCDDVKDLEHENACLRDAYNEMKDILIRTQKLLDCGLLFVHYTQRLEAASIIEKIDKLLPPAKEEEKCQT